MRWFVTALPALACVTMMLVVCVPMLMHRKTESGDAASKQEVEALRAEVTRLKAERAPEDSTDDHVST
jgi:hypothetical protein